MNLVVSIGVTYKTFITDIKKKKTGFFIASDRHTTSQNLVLQPVLNWANVCSRT